MISLAIQQLQARWQRSLAVFVAVMLGVAFFTIALLAGGPLNQNLRTGVGQQFYGSDLVVTSSIPPLLSQERLETVTAMDEVASADLVSLVFVQIQTGGARTYLEVGQVPSVPAVLDNMQLVSGTWPTEPGEIAVAENRMNQLSLSVGDEVELFSWESEETTSYTVVGVTESPSGLAFGRANAFLAESDYSDISSAPTMYAMRVQLEPGIEEGVALQNIQATLGNDFTVRTFNDYVDAEVDHFAGDTVAIQVLLGAFAAIAMVASGIVIANSFEISLAQRMREIGLLRSVGAKNRQIRRMVIVEALMVGLIASALGVGLGIGLMEIAGRLLWADTSGSTGLDLTFISVMAPIILGIIATVVSAFGPARGAMRVHPLQAIRQSEANIVSVEASRKRMIFAAITWVTGAAIMVFAVFSSMNGGAQSGGSLLLGILGGALTFFALLMSVQIILPTVTRILGKFSARLFGVTGELALGNLTRNPRRTASAAAALLMGVTLMTMMTVGASSVQSTIIGEIEDRQPIDLQIRVDSEAHDQTGEIDRWQAIEGVDGLTNIRAAEIQIGANPPINVVGVNPDEANDILRSDGLESLDDGIIVVTEDMAYAFDLENGDAIEVTGSNATVELRVHIDRAGVNEPVITLSTMQALIGDGVPSGVWIRLSDAATEGEVMDSVRAGLPSSMQLDVTGGAAERESVLNVLDTMLLVVIGLLAASVVIAIVGIGNTLTLSVIERTRESGMLRAMGLKRGQVRRMLAIEGVVISLVGTIVGIILGVVYGFAGVLTLFGDVLDFSFSVPWTQLGLICLIAMASGLMASVLPARRALGIKPVEALSDLG